jgi:hypothetical protein
MKSFTSKVRLARAALAAGLTLLAPGAARAQIPYKVQPILKVGDTVNGFAITPGYVFFPGPLNDRGQLAIGVGTNSGTKPELLVQYAEGQLTTIGGPGLDAPAGKFPADVTFDAPLGMNQLGNIVFAAARLTNPHAFGTFLWDEQAKTLTAVALTGMPATGNLTFAIGGGFAPVINNVGDIAFPAAVLNAAGKPSDGLFFRGRDGKLEAVALPDQALPGGVKVGQASFPSINDAGGVAFLTSPSAGSGVAANSPRGAFLWSQGSTTPLAVPGTDAPGGRLFKSAGRAWLNNANPTVLLAASVNSNSGPWGLYRFAGGTITPLVLPGQEMPGGGRLKQLFFELVSPANEAGQHVFEAILADDSQGAYRLDVDGKLSLILKSGMTTDLGPFTRFLDPNGSNVSIGISLNNKGQIAMVIESGSKPDTVVLLTPTTP